MRPLKTLIGERIPLPVAITAGAIAATVAAGLFLVFAFVDQQRDQALRDWQTRLGIVAESRRAALEDWIQRQYGVLHRLADNAALQLYMTEIAADAGGAGSETATAQAGYLRNLLVATAARDGFTGAVEGPAVNANVERIGVAGIALLDLGGRVLVATPDMPPVEGQLREAIGAAPRGERSFIDFHHGPGGRLRMGFVAPVFAVQGGNGSSAQIGMVLGLREAGPDPFSLLRQPGAVAETAETILVRRAGAVIEYLSPLAIGDAPLARKLAADTTNLAAAYAIENIGGFATKRDYRNDEVLITSRAVADTNWTLVHKIARAEALGQTDAWLGRLTAILLLTVALVTAALIAIWRHGTSRRAEAAARRHAETARRFESLGSFLKLVTDSQPNAIFITDEEDRYRFANREAARLAGIAPEDMLGKTITSVLGPDAAKRYRVVNHEVLLRDSPTSSEYRNGANGTTHIVQSEHIPFAPTGDLPRGVLVVERDITQAVTERERRERILAQVVDSLVRVVDRRDPFSADHSARAAQVARGIAEEMDLAPELAETAETAGRLMNLGKILVPAELLTKTAPLTDIEKDQIRDSIQTSAELLDGIEFDGPVVETLRQLQENWDGSGPRGLAGDDILITARVVAVANSFVAMISPRAYRPGADIDDAATAILREAGTTFDRRPVAALVSLLDSRGDRGRWSGPVATESPRP